MFERFTDRARRTVVLAQEEARMLNHNYIGTEHILLGLIHEGEGVAAKALELLGVSLQVVRQQVEEIIGLGTQPPPGHIPFTPRAKKVLELSLRESLQLSHNYIGTEHILLGLIREGDGVAAQVLVKLGADLNRVRQQVIQLLHGYQGTSSTPEPAQASPRHEGPVERWARAHADTVGQSADGGTQTKDMSTDRDLHATVAGLPLLAQAGIAVPLALLLDLVRLTGGSSGTDARLRALTSQPGISRLRALAWPPAARVGLAGLLICDLQPDHAFTAPDAVPRELRNALVAALGTGFKGLITSRELVELDQRIAGVRRDKESAIDSQDWEKAVALRDTEKQLLAKKAAWEKARPEDEATAKQALRDTDKPAGEQRGWQASSEIFDALSAAASEVTELTMAMLEILGPAATAADPTLPLKVRHRISALPRIGTRERRLIMESVAISTARSDITAATLGAVSGTNGVSRRGKVTGLLPAQLALPEELLEYRFVGHELLYRVNEADAQSPPEAVTIVLDTTPATYGPPELVLRLVAHVIAVTLWALHKTPALISLDCPRLVRHIAAPADLATLWTARTLDPPDVRAGLATARRVGASAILLTEHHLVRDLPVIPHRGMRVLTTHVADDPPAGRGGGPFHVHLPPDPTSAQVVKAVRDLLQPAADRRAS